MKPVPGIAIEHQPESALFACCLVAEAANDGEPGMAAVAQVIVNRASHTTRFPVTLRGVILQPWAFSSFNANDPNRARLLDLWHLDPKSYAIAEGIVVQANAGVLPDTVGPATHYCTNGLHGTLALWGHDDTDWIAQGHHPRWYSKQYIDAGLTKETATIGRQTFGVTQ